MSLPRKMKELDYYTGELIREFKSMRELSDFHDIDLVSVRYAMLQNDGYMHRKKLRFEYADSNFPTTRVIKRVRQVDFITGEEIEIYKSVEEAAEDNFIAPEKLREVLRLRDGCMKLKELKFEYVD